MAGYVVEEGKGLVIAVNKWDLVAGQDRTGPSTSTSSGSATRSRSSTSPRSSRSAPRPASASAASWRPPSTSGASGASGSRPASSTGCWPPRPSGRRRRRSGPPARSCSTRPRRPWRRRPSSSSPPTRRPSISATGATSRTGCARRSASTARRSGWSSATGPRSSCRAAARSSGAHRWQPGEALEAVAAERAGRAAGQAGLMSGPRVAVVGAGRLGHDARAGRRADEPVTLLCHSPETAARIAETGRNEARLPGIDPPGDRGRDRRPGRLCRRRPTSSSSRRRRPTFARRRRIGAACPGGRPAVRGQGPRAGAPCCG